MALRRGAWLAMPRIAAPRAPGRKPWETVSMSHYQRSLVLYQPPLILTQRLIPLLPARLNMDRLASTISGRKSVGLQRNHGLVGVVPAEAAAQHLGLPERTG